MTYDLIVYCDGGARGNPGPAAAAFAVIKDGKMFYKDSRFLGKATNNVAEYAAVVMALKWLSKKNLDNKNILLILSS
jgi:ribonuclease HI